MRSNKWIRVVTTIAFVLGFLTTQVRPALAVWDTGTFQLDGNPQYCANPTPSAPGDDWDNALGSTLTTLGIPHRAPACAVSSTLQKPAATSFEQDGSKRGVQTDTSFSPAASIPADVDFLTGGGTKDTGDFPSWTWSTSATLQDKDDIMDAGAAAYTVPSSYVTPTGSSVKPGDELLYFTADRFDNSGDSDIGFWFTQNAITQKPVPAGSTTAGFNGTHAVNDLLVVSNFGNGGAVGSVVVYTWTATGLSGPKTFSTSSGTADCSLIGPGPITCAKVNTTTTPSAWPFVDKSGSAGQYLSNEFFEGGIDITAFFGGITPCISSFLAETRSSTSNTATLKDFAIGSFQTCKARISLTPPTATNRAGNAETYTAKVEAQQGAGNWMPVNGVTVTGSIANALGSTATITGGTCSTGTTGANSQPAGTCTITISSLTTGKATLDASTNTFNFNGQSLSASTKDATNLNLGGTGAVTKYFVNAAITVAPNKTNEVGHTHTFTVTVTEDTGDGTGLSHAGTNVQLNTAIVNSNGATGAMAGGNCGAATGLTGGGTTDATTGTCTVIVNSPTAGQITINATAPSVVVTAANGLGAAAFSITTDGKASDSGPAVKTYVDAGVSITPPKATNHIGDPETYTIAVTKNLGDGNGFVPANGASVSATLSNNTAGASFSGPSTCTTAGTGASAGTCQVTITASTPGSVTVTAQATLTVTAGGNTNQVTMVRTTGDSFTQDSPPAVKFFVDAAIAIGPASATNGVGVQHTFTVTLYQNTGDGTGYNPVGAGYTITTSISNSNGATGAMVGGTCGNTSGLTGTGQTNSSGQCTIIVDSSTPGDVTATASATLHVVASNGLGSKDFTVSTNGVRSGTPNTGPAVKHYIPGSIQVLKKVDVGPFTAAPQVCYTLSHDPSNAGPVISPIASDTSAPGANPSYTNSSPDASVSITECYQYPANTSGAITTESFTFSYHGLASGTYMLHETVGAPYHANPDITGLVVDLTDATKTNVSAPDQTNPLPPGSLKIIKTVNKGNLAPGAGPFIFTINSCAAGSSGTTCSSPVAVNTTASISCPGAPNTTPCDATVANYVQSNLTEGLYQVVETSVPSGYTIDTATNGQVVKVFAANAPSQAQVTVNNIRLLRMIIFTCDMQGNLVGSSVNSTDAPTPGTQGPTLTSPPNGVTAAQLCGLAPANYTNLLPNSTYHASVTTPAAP